MSGAAWAVTRAGNGVSVESGASQTEITRQHSGPGRLASEHNNSVVSVTAMRRRNDLSIDAGRRAIHCTLIARHHQDTQASSGAGSLVAAVHRILMRGGIFAYPRDRKDPARPGRLRLLCEAGPMAMLVEQAGGAASTGREPILGIAPEGLHQRVPVVLGSRDEVAVIERYHAAQP